MISSRMISFQKVLVKSRLDDVLEALGEYKCDAGMSVENMPAVDNITTLMGRFIALKFSTGWAVGVVKSGKEEECCWPVCSQV